MEILKNIEISGLIAGIAVFIIIIVARWLCIWGEYHFSKKFWIFFLVVGIISVSASIFVTDLLISSILSANGFIFLWGIHETIEQEERVKKGWFKKKNKKH
jgi:MFS-type transporter involved in bile tolerance (Atg22 family)